MSKYVYRYNFPVGFIYIAEERGAITDVAPRPLFNAVEKETPLISKAAGMLYEYFDGIRVSFEDLPLRADGTVFQRKVWDALVGIPYGETRSYKEQAKAVGNANACRAVGAANGKNPIMIIIPCHRVIGSDGSLTGYAGGLDIKKALLEFERSNRKQRFTGGGLTPLST
ncbi:MAG: methylated-DNA--[protein]-cysteine S-methyltransferase [Oscillospiraceae bacterium]|nr:methylated-DNA--[protein]-cysteine S-methyltransferase [Oscillospiraceae bacterium]